MEKPLRQIICADDVIRAGACAEGVHKACEARGFWAGSIDEALAVFPNQQYMILRSVDGNGYGDNYGDGDGDGNGDGYGYGNSDGYGYDYGYGYGDGNGYGYGNSYGYDYGDGNGNDYGYGDGYG